MPPLYMCTEIIPSVKLMIPVRLLASCECTFPHCLNPNPVHAFGVTYEVIRRRECFPCPRAIAVFANVRFGVHLDVLSV